MSHHHQPLKIIETSHISPPNGTVPSTTLPLTFFDIEWLNIPPIQSLFFFSYPKSSTDLFLKDFLPNLKHSLSITLQHFFPYAGKLISLPRPNPPYLRYTDGEDSLVFTLAESNRNDFKDLITDSPKDIKILHDYVPNLPPPHVSPERIQIRPAMAMQVTIFPGSGICIGNTSLHIVGDGVTFIHFMKYWMSLTKFNGGDPSTFLLPLPPIHSCRNVIKDPDEVAAGNLKRFWSKNSGNNKKNKDTASLSSENMVRATFTIRRNQIDNLKRLVTDQSQSRVSTFVVTLAIAWTSLIKTLLKDDKTETDIEEDAEEDFHLVIGVDCRNRLKYQEPVPSTYFGNCIAPGFISIKKQDLVGENGVLAASNAIAAKIEDILSSNIVETAPTWGQEVGKLIKSRFLVAVAGSPKLRRYDLDFGLGKPCKMEIVHIEKTSGAIALSESRDGTNGVEIGLVLETKKMEAFNSILQDGINKFNM